MMSLLLPILKYDAAYMHLTINLTYFICNQVQLMFSSTYQYNIQSLLSKLKVINCKYNRPTQLSSHLHTNILRLKFNVEHRGNQSGRSYINGSNKLNE